MRLVPRQLDRLMRASGALILVLATLIFLVLLFAQTVGVSIPTILEGLA